MGRFCRNPKFVHTFGDFMQRKMNREANREVNRKVNHELEMNREVNHTDMILS